MESEEVMDEGVKISYGGWLIVKKALLGAEKSSDTTWHCAEVILDVALAYVLKNSRKRALTTENIS